MHAHLLARSVVMLGSHLTHLTNHLYLIAIILNMRLCQIISVVTPATVGLGLQQSSMYEFSSLV